tara:strand:- start:966 stop:2732 length:1767 start_codon:yes stop_codon:yes gene_type:complete
MVNIYYKKNKNDNLFKDLENSSLELSNLQNYIPIYDKFFSFNDNNSNYVNLNHKYHINNLKNPITKNIILCSINDNSNNSTEVESFLKFSPLLDPLKYLCGKYDLSKSIILPNTHNKDDCINKILDENNSAYVDSFFTFLSSQCLHELKFLNALDFYGSFLAIKNNFRYDVADDIDYLNDCDYFHKNNNILFKLDNCEMTGIFNVDSRNNKEKLNISSKSLNISCNSLNSLQETSGEDIICDNEDLEILDISNISVIYNNNLIHKKSESSCSSYSSKSCNTTLSETEENNNDDNNSIDDYDDNSNEESIEEDLENDDDIDIDDDDFSSYVSEEEINININNFPVQIICLENCEDTLDSLMVNDELEENEWKSAIFQIIITLVLYQKCFDFTHNDLHTNNIMYIKTNKQFLYYCYNGIHYKVPTYGKIYKIIDFGRSIYKFQNKLICSDSFHMKGDASTQYNFPPYYDSKKPEILPNPSFDLCRLACSMFDSFIEDFKDMESICNENKIVELICSWLIDDNGKNILYKVNGEERYPEFKLYKMIARHVHNHTPAKQLYNSIFKEYIIPKKKMKKINNIMNIDKIPIFYN